MQHGRHDGLLHNCSLVDNMRARSDAQMHNRNQLINVCRLKDGWLVQPTVDLKNTVCTPYGARSTRGFFPSLLKQVLGRENLSLPCIYGYGIRPVLRKEATILSLPWEACV